MLTDIHLPGEPGIPLVAAHEQAVTDIAAQIIHTGAEKYPGFGRQHPENIKFIVRRRCDRLPMAAPVAAAIDGKRSIIPGAGNKRSALLYYGMVFDTIREPDPGYKRAAGIRAEKDMVFHRNIKIAVNDFKGQCRSEIVVL